MAHKQAALRALAALAQEPQEDLALPQEQASLLARELWRFLAIKRDELAKAGAGADAAARAPLPVSPGPRVDALWHAMLLESDVTDQVHAALGAVVPHSQRAEMDLCDAEKRWRRLNALALFAERGWAPALGFWLVTEEELRAEREQRALRAERRARRAERLGDGAKVLHVRTVAGASLTVFADAAMTLAEFELEAHDLAGVFPSEHLALLHYGRRLVGDREFRDLSKESTLQQMWRRVGPCERLAGGGGGGG